MRAGNDSSRYNLCCTIGLRHAVKKSKGVSSSLIPSKLKWRVAAMTDDREALVSEIQRLRKQNRRWRIIAFVVILSAIVVMLPFTVAVFEIADYFHWKQREREFKALTEEYFHAVNLIEEQRKREVDVRVAPSK